MTYIEIVKQLINGNHLSESELEKAKELLLFLTKEINKRIKEN